jgi:transcription elongation factor GreA
MAETHLSPTAHQRLQEELAWRSGERRREISEWIERAREHGDIRENADYDAAKNEQGHNEARVRQLEAMLREVVVVDEASGDVVAPGTIVEIKMEGDDETTHYLVGSIEERHADYEVLSVSSPLGQALMGAGPGDTVTYEGPRRKMSVEVVSVRPAV